MSPLKRLTWLAALAADLRLTVGALRVAMALTQWIGKDTGSCFPSVASIGAAVGMKERGTRHVIRQLEDAGWLGVVRTVGRTSNVYTPRMPTRHNDAGSTGHDHTGSSAANPAPDGLQPGTGTSATRHLACRLTREQGEQDAEQADVGPTFTLRDGGHWRPSKALVEKLTAAYPKIDVQAELLRAALWTETATPTKRKTLKGMARFLRNWIANSRPRLNEGYATPADEPREFTVAEAQAMLGGPDAP